MRNIRHRLAAAIAMLLIAAFIALPLPSAAAQDKPPAEKKKTVLSVGAGHLVIKKTGASAFTFKLTDPNTGEAVLAKGTVEATEKSLHFRMTEPGGRATSINATRIDANAVVYRLETAGAATDITVTLPDLNGGDATRPVEAPLPIIRQDEFRAYVEAASQSKGLPALASALDVSQSSAKLGRGAAMLARLVYLARGGRAASTDVRQMSVGCGAWAGLNFRMCMIDYSDPWYCFWDSVFFLIACLL